MNEESLQEDSALTHHGNTGRLVASHSLVDDRLGALHPGYPGFDRVQACLDALEGHPHEDVQGFELLLLGHDGVHDRRNKARTRIKVETALVVRHVVVDDG